MKKILLVGAGGLGSPAALVLARSGGVALTVLDDDLVDLSNLHRQILYDDADLGHDKAERAAARLAREGAAVRAIRGRLLPTTARALVGEHDLVVEGADNFATKFLASDACALARVPLVSAGCVRWSGWALASIPGQSACLRCVFEDIPRDRVETCAEAGVIGPVVGVLGALEAALAIRVLRGDTRAAGVLHHYRALDGVLRARSIRRREGCPSCAGEIRDLRLERYASPPSDERTRYMAITVRIPTPLRTLTGGSDEVHAEGATVREVIDDLEAKHPGIKDRLLDEKGVRRFVNIFANDEDIRFLDNLDTALGDGDAVQIIPAIAGGR